MFQKKFLVNTLCAQMRSPYTPLSLGSQMSGTAEGETDIICSYISTYSSNHLKLGRRFNQNVSMSLDSLAVETAKPHTNRLYRTVSRYHEKGDLPICTATRLSVSSMDLSQPSVAARKEFWEERAKSREPSHPCRNCQVAQDIAEQLAWLPLVYNKFLQVSMTS